MKTIVASALMLLAIDNVVPSDAFLVTVPKSVATASILEARSQPEAEKSFLLEEFSTHTGEIVDPYKVLKLPRKAERMEIKQAYRALSRRYHPDSVMHRDILPGSCNNLDDVREEWERIKLSYEILSDSRRRKRYDRHETLADPGKAVKRAAVDAAVSGVAGVGSAVGKGLFDFGAFAFNKIKSSYENHQGSDEEPTIIDHKQHEVVTNRTATGYNALETQ